jgi:carbon-monoxide dehydrogenase large subunit
VHGDTGRVPFGMGTYGSRSLSVGGTAIMKALDKIEAKAKKIAAHLMEASDADIEFSGGEFTVAGTDKKIPFAQVALTAYVPHNYPLDKLEPGLNETPSTTRPTSPIRPAPTSARSRSTRPRAWCASTASPPWTTSAPSSTR